MTELKPDQSEPEAAPASAAASAATPGTEAGDLRSYINAYLRRVRSGDMGSLPAIGGLVVLVVVFLAVQPVFRGLYNFGNMFTEGSATIFIAMGLVFVLLLGEIDLAAGFTAGVAASVMARLMEGYDQGWWVTIPAAIATGVLIGLITGLLVAKVRIPSFVVTLAFFLAFQGVTLFVLNNGKGPTGSITLHDKVVNGFANSQMPKWIGWLLAVLVIAGYAGQKLMARLQRHRQGLGGEPAIVVGAKIAALSVVALLLVFALNQNRALNQQPIKKVVYVDHVPKYVTVSPPAVEGVPYVVPVLLVLFVALTFVLTRTRYGRHVYAVGGNEEAARRAGISVDFIRITVFMISSGLAAVGGIMISSNVSSVAANSFGGNTLLLAVGAAVIGGTSLFGGRGRILDALIGGAVVEVIYNGFGNLFKSTNSSAIQLIALGLALALAATIDALSRRRATSSGIA